MSDDKQETLQERVERQRREREQPREGHEVSADGKELETPERRDFFSNLEKVSKDEK